MNKEVLQALGENPDQLGLSRPSQWESQNLNLGFNFGPIPKADTLMTGYRDYSSKQIGCFPIEIMLTSLQKVKPR